MKLTTKERLTLLQILPVQASYTDITIITDLKKELGLSEEEHKKLKIKTFPDHIEWDDEAEAEISPKEINIGPRALTVIYDALIERDKKKQLTEHMKGIYEKFVLDKDKDNN